MKRRFVMQTERVARYQDTVHETIDGEPQHKCETSTERLPMTARMVVSLVLALMKESIVGTRPRIIFETGKATFAY